MTDPTVHEGKADDIVSTLADLRSISGRDLLAAARDRAEDPLFAALRDANLRVRTSNDPVLAGFNSGLLPTGDVADPA